MRRNDIIMLAGLTTLVSSAIYFLSNKRSRLVKVALGEVGKARTSVYSLDAYGSEVDKNWCGIFILWALHQVGLAKDWKWEVGKGFIYKLNTTLVPKPGDIAYFNKLNHQALVKSVEGDNVRLINGNGMNGVVSESLTPKKNVTAFYSIESLL